jgi:Mn2+/Fe2+ NRAMP family transporter
MSRSRPADEGAVPRPGWVAAIGPELVSAASDNDPTNVGTVAAVGAQTGYQLSWVALLVAPLLAIVLTIAAQVGTVARDDLQSLTRRRYGSGPGVVLLVSVVAVNLVTIAADLQAGAAGLGLLAGIDARWLLVPLGATLAGLPVAGRYTQMLAVLRVVMLGFLASGVLVASVGLALAVSLVGVPVIDMLVAASVVGGLGAPIGLVVLVRLARDREVMGAEVITARLAFAGWAVAVIVGGFGVLYVVAAAGML